MANTPMHWHTTHLDACKMMIAARLGCQVAADVPGLDGEKGYRITNAGRAAYKIEKARLKATLIK